MGAPSKLAVTEAQAASMLSLPRKEFAALVTRGALPRPVRIGSHDRWSVEALNAVLTGTKVEEEAFEP